MNYWWASRKIWTLASRYQRQRSSCFLFVPSFCGHARARARTNTRTRARVLHLPFPFLTGFDGERPCTRTKRDGLSLSDRTVFLRVRRRTNTVANEQMGRDRRHRTYCITSYSPLAGGSCSRYSLAWPRFTFAHFHRRSPGLPAASPDRTVDSQTSFQRRPEPSSLAFRLMSSFYAPPSGSPSGFLRHLDTFVSPKFTRENPSIAGSGVVCARTRFESIVVNFK